jgi:predicted HTH domain antitoxin
LVSKKDKIEELAIRLLEKETISLPDIVEILGPRPFPLKDSILEYLEELK